MLHQRERVPQQYVLDEARNGLAETKASAAISLRSTDETITDPASFQFEAISPNIFRTTFSTKKHPIPLYPSVRRPTPNFGGSKPDVTTEGSSHIIKIGKVKAVVDFAEAPIVSIFLDGVEKPLHKDLPWRSYVVDDTGVSHYSVFKQDTLHVGLGEKAGSMDLSNRGFLISASDTFGYDAYRTDPLYKHIPFLINASPAGVVGIFSTSHNRATWDVGSELDGMWGHYKVYRQAHGGLEEYFIVGKTVAEVVRSYAELVGFPLRPPRYMMGYVGGGMKYSMEDEPRAVESLLGFLKNAQKHGMPCSAFQMSSGYTVAEQPPKTRNVFTWNYHRFPDPRGFTKEAHKLGVRLLANVKPYILASHPNYKELVESGAFFTDPVTKKTAVARLWSAGGGESGEGSHLDFTSKAGFNFWYNGVKALKEVGIDAMWNDNNEYNIPNDDWQCALETIPVPEGETRKDVGLWGRALHTELNGKSSYDATVEVEPNVRPFILTRSATAGTMRYAASSWSGDNVTSWEGMKGANALALNAGFSNIPCYGHDIGGFEGPQPTAEHLVRWIQLGVHSPRFAINCYKTNPDDNLIGEVIEPWQYPSAAPIIRKTIGRRYELVPYTYAQILRSHLDATPPQRWTGWGYESDPVVWSHDVTRSDSQYWFGDALLIAGVYEPGVTSARVYLPHRDGELGFLNLSAPYQYLAPGKWHEILSSWHDSIPVLARIGSAIPIGKSKPTTTRADEDPEFPNLAKDDYRGIEIFPPPKGNNPGLTAEAQIISGTKQFESKWLEDDGFSPEDKADLIEATVIYAVSENNIQVKVSVEKQGSFEPLWVKNGVSIILPVWEERIVKSLDGGKGRVENAGRDDKGRQIWKLDVVVSAKK
ncbi:family 31 glycosyl hydrolase [Biscogniauxia marginata]|nr:family 31 glycosyl hydrolase [Biscogniauxia marginata]